MKKINITILLMTCFLVITVLSPNSGKKFSSESILKNTVAYAETSYWEWSTSESASAFVKTMTNRGNGILMSNFPLKSWTIKIHYKEKFNSIITNRSYLRNFIAKRVYSVCTENKKDKNKCYAARKFLKEAWVGETDDGHLASYEFALTFYKVDFDNWFSFEGVRGKIASYLETPYHGVRIFRQYLGFKHHGVLSQGGISIKTLPVVIDTAEQTITFYSASLYD